MHDTNHAAHDFGAGFLIPRIRELFGRAEGRERGLFRRDALIGFRKVFRGELAIFHAFHDPDAGGGGQGGFMTDKGNIRAGLQGT